MTQLFVSWHSKKICCRSFYACDHLTLEIIMLCLFGSFYSAFRVMRQTKCRNQITIILIPQKTIIHSEDQNAMILVSILLHIKMILISISFWKFFFYCGNVNEEQQARWNSTDETSPKRDPAVKRGALIIWKTKSGWKALEKHLKYCSMKRCRFALLVGIAALHDHAARETQLISFGDRRFDSAASRFYYQPRR